MRFIVGAALLWAALFSYLAVSRHNAFESNAFDLGYVTQTLWNTAHGHPFVFTTVDGIPFSPEGSLDVNRLRKPHSLLAFHVEPILLIVAPIFALWSDARLLLVIQAFGLGAGAIATASLALRRIGNLAAAIVFGLAFLLAPSVAAAAMSDFHGVAFLPLLIPVVLCLFDAGRNRLGFATAMLAALAREDAAILVAALGAYFFVRGVIARRRGLRVKSTSCFADPFDRLDATGRWIMIAAGLWAVLALGAIVPFFNGTIGAIIHHQPAVGSVFWHRYDWLGSNPVSAARDIVLKPGLLLDWFARPDVLAYLTALALTSGLVAIVAPDVLVVALPIILLNALSSFDWMRSAGAHYSVIVVPVLLFAGIEGTRRALGWTNRLQRSKSAWLRAAAKAVPATALGLVLISATVNHVRLEASPLVPGRVWPQPTARNLAVEKVLAEIPPDASVAATSAVYPHVATRARAYWFPAVDNAEYVAVDAVESTDPIGASEVRARTTALVATGSYEVADATSGFLLLRRLAVPAGSARLSFPDRFYDFARVDAADRSTILSGPPTIFGGSISLDGVAVDRQSSQTIFGPDATVTTYWHAVGPVADHLSFHYVVTRRSDGAAIGSLSDASAEAVWYPPGRWKPGETVKMTVRVLRIDDLQAIGVSIVTGDNQPLPIDAPSGAALWNNATVVRVFRFDGGG